MIPVAVMCGGRGIRLHPLTDSRPKPLFNVGGKPILEQILDGFASQGFRAFHLCVNYRAELIEQYFGDGSARGLDIRYAHEREALGTAGGLANLTGLSGPLIVQNGDVLTRIDYRALLRTHAERKAQATVSLALHQHQIPYGVARFEGEVFTGLREKPIENVLVNAGIYVLDSNVLAAICGHCDMPDLIDRCSPKAFFPVEHSWHDCGNFVDLARANNEW